MKLSQNGWHHHWSCIIEGKRDAATGSVKEDQHEAEQDFQQTCSK